MSIRMRIGICVGLVGLPFALDGIADLLAYSPYGDPGAEARGAWLCLLALALFAVPVCMVLSKFVQDVRRQRQAFLDSLTPEQRRIWKIGEWGALAGGSAALYAANRAWDRSLTERVMGEPGENRFEDEADRS